MLTGTGLTYRYSLSVSRRSDSAHSDRVEAHVDALLLQEFCVLAHFYHASVLQC